MSTRLGKNVPPRGNRPADSGGSPQSPERFYYANGKKIPLAPSPRFMTVRARGQTGEEVAAAATAALTATPSVRPPQVMPIPGHALALVALEDTGTVANVTPGQPSLAAMNAMLRAGGPGLSAGPTVYELPEEGEAADAPVLIPVGEVIVQFRPTTTQEQRDQLLKRHRAEMTRQDPNVPDRMVVRVKADEEAIDVANALQEDEQVEYAEPNFATIVREVSGSNGSGAGNGASGGAGVLENGPDAAGSKSATVQLPQGRATEALREPTVDEFAAAPAAPPNDPGFASQWALQKIRAPEAWEITPGNPGVKVAVLDEGCDISHEDIAYQLPGYDALDNDNDPSPAGNDAHGTACAGIIAMRRNNAKGGVGVAPGCRVLPIRIAKGIGGGGWYTSPAIVDAGIRKALALGADALSNSYSLAPSTTVTKAFQDAQTQGRGGKGCPTAAASGNADQANGIIYPARLSPTIPGFMAVGASNQWDQRKSKTSQDGENWWGSSYGPQLDVVAPGVKIYSTDITGQVGYGSGNYIPNFNGTSSATPHVAGLMGLVLSVDPNLRGWEVEEIIKTTAVDLGATGRDVEFGFGRIDCRRALEAASRVWEQHTQTPVFIGVGQECFLLMRLRVFNSGINRVRLNSVVVRSLSPVGAEIDRFEYLANPGGIMLPRTGNDVRFPRILLRANGNRRRWSYRYTIGWSYTFWRPTGPGLPLGGTTEPTESGEEGTGTEIVVVDSGGEETAAAPGAPREWGQVRAGVRDGFARAEDVAAPGDVIAIDRETRALTIVIR